MGQHRYGETEEQREVIARIIDYRRKPHKKTFKEIAEIFAEEKIPTKQKQAGWTLQLVAFLYERHAGEILSQQAGSL